MRTFALDAGSDNAAPSALYALLGIADIAAFWEFGEVSGGGCIVELRRGGRGCEAAHPNVSVAHCVCVRACVRACACAYWE